MNAAPGAASKTARSNDRVGGRTGGGGGGGVRLTEGKGDRSSAVSKSKINRKKKGRLIGSSMSLIVVIE